jgi:hypothetical protein
MNTAAILNEVERLHATAKRIDTLKLADQTYALTFNGRNYLVTDEEGKRVVEFNTRKITVAKKWLREYMAN